MTAAKKTHREVKNPQISARYLADYMDASEQAARTIVRNCKYHAIARVIQHDEAKQAIGKFLRSESTDTTALSDFAQSLRDRLADDDFDRNLYDSNADYIDRFVAISSKVGLPKAEILPPGKPSPIIINDVKVTLDLVFRAQRLTRTNKVRVGGGMLRYQKNKALSPEVGLWQSALLFGVLGDAPPDGNAEPEQKLCATIDAHAGALICAPGDAGRRYQNMRAACLTIAERWPNIAPPPNAVL